MMCGDPFLGMTYITCWWLVKERKKNGNINKLHTIVHT